MNCNTTHYRANSSSVPGDPTAGRCCHPACWHGSRDPPGRMRGGIQTAAHFTLPRDQAALRALGRYEDSRGKRSHTVSGCTWKPALDVTEKRIEGNQGRRPCRSATRASCLKQRRPSSCTRRRKAAAAPMKAPGWSWLLPFVASPPAIDSRSLPGGLATIDDNRPGLRKRAHTCICEYRSIWLSTLKNCGRFKRR